MKTLYLDTPIGRLLVIANDGQLIYCNWEEPECNSKRTKAEGIEARLSRDKEDDNVIRETIRQLDEYFQGKRKTFDIPIKFYGNDFQKTVWKEIYKIQYGQTISYGDLAQNCRRPRAVRAVANACGKNPVSVIVPCHRVIATGGKTGGYTGGIDKKIWLLQHEKSL